MKTFGLIGYPLSHSFSGQYFNEKFRNENIDARFVNFPIESIDNLPEILNRPEIAGLSVTLPYKQQVIPFLDELSEEASNIGAINVIRFIRESEKTILKGYNSDVWGFVNSLKPLLDSHHKKALILGTGGASKAVAYGLFSLGIEYRFVSRTQGENLLSYNTLTPNIIDEHKLIINTTPLGMYPKTDECPDIPYSAISEKHLAYDLTYNPEITTFLMMASRQGAKIKNGKEMLILQAERAWGIWNE